MAGTGPSADEIPTRKRWAWRRVQITENQCQHCDTWFVPNRKDQAYCGSVCRVRAFRQRQEERKKATRQALAQWGAEVIQELRVA